MKDIGIGVQYMEHTCGMIQLPIVSGLSEDDVPKLWIFYLDLPKAGPDGVRFVSQSGVHFTAVMQVPGESGFQMAPLGIAPIGAGYYFFPGDCEGIGGGPAPYHSLLKAFSDEVRDMDNPFRGRPVESAWDAIDRMGDAFEAILQRLWPVGSVA